MATKSVTLPNGAVIKIRPYRPEDHDDVLRIFSAGMLGLARGGTGHVLANNWPLKALSYALPAASLLVTRRCSQLWKAAAAVGAAAFVPCLAFALLRRAMTRYVVESIAGPDLSSIEHFYSALGAGHGSAFWVAELIEPEPATPTAPSDTATQLTPRPSRSASAAGTHFQSGAKAADAPVPATLLEEGPVTRTTGSPAGRAQQPEMAPEQSGEPGDEHGDATATVGSETGSPGSPGSPAAGAGSADAEERDVRSLVAGLVAAAVSRIERASSSTATTATMGLTCEDAALEPEGPGADSKNGPEFGAAKAQVAAAAAAPAMPVPGTPVVVVERPRIGSFAEPAPVSAPLPAQGPAGAAAAAMAVVASQSLRSGGAEGGGGDRRPIIIGHVALERKSWRLAELRRMSVLKQYAGQGVGGRLLETLVAHARDVGFRELVLYTSGMQPAARRLYTRGGWSVGKVSRVQGMDVYMYTLDLTRRA